MRTTLLFTSLFIIGTFLSVLGQQGNQTLTVGPASFELIEPATGEVFRPLEYLIHINDDEICVCLNQFTSCGMKLLPTTNLSYLAVHLGKATNNKSTITDKQVGKIETYPFCIDYRIQEQFGLFRISYLIYDNRNKTSIPLIQFAGKEMAWASVMTIDKIVRSISAIN